MKDWFLYLLLLASPAAAQRPTGTIVFAGPTAQPRAPALRQAEHLRAWLAHTCATWSELAGQPDSTQYYRGQLAGVHPDVVLSFAVRVSRRPLVGWQYLLLGFRVGAPTRAGLVQWVQLHRLLDDPDFRPDMLDFQQQLQHALPTL